MKRTNKTEVRPHVAKKRNSNEVVKFYMFLSKGDILEKSNYVRVNVDRK